jgi:iron complex transport system substrate-binding protein
LFVVLFVVSFVVAASTMLGGCSGGGGDPQTGAFAAGDTQSPAAPDAAEPTGAFAVEGTQSPAAPDAAEPAGDFAVEGAQTPAAPDAVEPTGAFAVEDAQTPAAPFPVGDYHVDVTLSGDMGAMAVESPARVAVRESDGGTVTVTATVVFKGADLTYMTVGGEEYLPAGDGGDPAADVSGSDEGDVGAGIAGSDESDGGVEMAGSVESDVGAGIAGLAAGSAAFEIPVTLDTDIPVALRAAGVGAAPGDTWCTLRFHREGASLALDYATGFAVDYSLDAPRITFADGSAFAVTRHPQKVYLAATGAMCAFDVLGALPLIAFSGTQAEGWYIENARLAMERGDFVYAGKYSAPDYELLLAAGCDLAVESNMINHVPEVKEKLESLGIPVLVDSSSYEAQPLGRAEWVKLYGVLLGKEKEAMECFDAQAAAFREVAGKEPTGKTVAFFYFNPSGQPVVRKSGDYVAKMISMAGGEYVFGDMSGWEGATGIGAIEMETFYHAAKDADILIYNSTMGEELESLEDLLAYSALLGDFKAVQNGGVWQVNRDFYQETTSFGKIITDFRKVFEGGDTWKTEDFDFLRPLGRSSH